MTWSKPIVLSQNDDPANKPDAEGQGTVIAIDPSVPANQPARIYVAWRVFAEPGDPDDANQIRIARSSDGGISFDEQEPAVTFPLSCNKKPTGVGCPFDQGETGTSFRSNGYPGLTVDNAGRVYLAWSQRDKNGDGRIMMTVMNRVEQCSSSRFKQIDSGAVYDDYGNGFTNLSDRGSQLMPTLNFNAGKLMLTYYDLRQDHTSGALTPAPEPTCDPVLTPLCPIGNPFTELREFAGELLTNPTSVFTPYVDDSTLTVRRHTLDIVGSEGAPVSNPWSLDVPSFTHFRVSRYEYGIIPPGTDVQEAQFNAPNLPMFVQGTAPFMGDYIDVAGAPAMVSDNSRSGYGWKFNSSPTTNPVFHATWTDNRDVLPPPDGVSWGKYTPPISASIGPTSKFDPTKTPPACVSGYSGMRNQNIYTSAISHGLILTSPQTAKPVLQANGQPIPREFSLVMRNETNDSRTFQLTIPVQPAGAQASFLQFSLQNTLTVNIPALSSASRPVFLTPSAGSTALFPAFEVDAAETDGAKPPLTASILFNADPTNPALANPDNAAFGAGSISSQEFYNPAILNPAILNPAILNPAILNPAILNPAILNPAILNPAILNPAILNPNFVVALNPAILNPAILNPAILNNAVANPAILNPAILNTPVSDANYTITNEGNTSATYQLQLFQSGPLPASAVFQIILTKTYLTPGVSPTDGCTYGGQVNNEVVASINNPVFVTDASQLGNPAILNSAINNPTFSIAPGDTLQVTLRANLTVDQLANVVLPNLSPVVAAQAVNTVDVQQGITTPPITLLISTIALPSAVTGQPYSAALTALGGIPPVSADAWSLIGGSLPPGLNLSAAGIISGTPTDVGTFPFVVQVTDTGTPQHIASRQFSITVAPPVAITTPALPNAAPGAQYTQVVTATGGLPPYTWTSNGTLPPGLTLSRTTGVISGIPTTAGTYTFSVMVSDSQGVFATASYTIVISTTVTQPAQITFLVQPSNAVGSQAISPAVQVQVLDAAGAAIPNTPVVIGFGNQACSAAVLSGSVTATTNASGIASLANLSIDRGQLAYTLRATAGNATAVSNPFTVNGFCPAKAPISVPRELHSAVTLLDGTVLVAGGGSRLPGLSSPGLPVASAELYNASTGTFSATGSMNVPRWGQTTTLLRDGRVLIAGGVNSSSTAVGSVTNTAEIYDPATHTFALTNGPMNSARFLHTATLLADGRVLLAGGGTTVPPDCILCFGVTTTNTAEIFDPATGLFTPTSTPLTVQRQVSAATLMPNGQVLLAGGLTDGPTFTSSSSAEVFDPVSNVFRATSSMTAPRVFHDATLLSNGKVLVAGGNPGNQSTAELYDPATGTFAATGNLVGPSGLPAIVLTDGTVLLSVQNAQVYNASTGVFSATGGLVVPNNTLYGTSLLHDGSVLATGGETLFGTVPEEGTITDTEVYYSTATLAPISITTASLFTATIGQPFTQILLDQGGVGNLTWSESGTLPTGVTFSSQGILTGTPTVSGTFPLTFTVTDSSTPAKSITSGTLTLTVSAAVAQLVFAPQTLRTAITGSAYTPSIVASGGAAPYNFVVTSGALPTGITLGAYGTFSGTTTAVGSFPFGVTVTDSSAPPQTATQSFTMQVANPLAITTSELPGGTVGTPYTVNISTTGGVLPVGFALTAGALPPGLGLSLAAAPPQTATLSGTPTTAGTFTFTITAADSASPVASASQSYTITIGTATVPPANVIFIASPQNSIEGQLLTGSPVSVRVTDANNTPIPNAAVSIGFNGIAPCSAATLGGTLTQTTDVTGIATFADLTINRGQYGFALAAAAGNVIGTSNAFNVEGFCDTGNLTTPRVFHSSVALPNGTVLIAGGLPAFSGGAPLSSAELYNPATHSFTTVGSMNSPRWGFTMTPLQNGLVLVVGGTNSSSALSSAELFNPASNTFTLLPASMVAARAHHTATLLPSGKVLITGGSQSAGVLASAETFDPATNTFTATTGSMTSARFVHRADLLPNGQVLITGGEDASINILASAELYDPVANTFTSTGAMSTPREEHASAVLFDGTVLIAGGATPGPGGTQVNTATAELYNPATGAFSPTASAAQTMFGFSSAVPVLADGTVFLLSNNQDAQIYSPTAATFRLTANSTALQQQAQTALLPDGTVLVAGGGDSTGTGLANAEVFYPINIIPISITTLLPTALVNVPYSQQLEEKGGVGTLTWTLSSGTLPAGLTLSTSGLLSGTPTVIGASIFTVQVTDSSTPPRATTAQFIVAVVPPLTVLPFLPTANPGVAYSQTLLIAGGASPYTFSIISGSLPAGLALNNGIVSGTTSALGTFTFTVKATDSSTPPVSTTQAITITVAPPLAISPTTLPGGQVGVAYNATFSATGGSGAILFGLASGTLPVGLTLTPLGVLSGTPTVASTFTFTIAVVDSSTEPQIAEQTYTVVIAPAAAPLALGPASLPAATVGVAYAQNFSISGGAPPYTTTQTGTLPPGLAFNGATNPPSITGSPTSVGTFGNITVTATDSLGAQVQVTYSITVNAFSAACATGKESLFNGQYAILMEGFDANGPRTLIGSISANGAGGIPSGQLDIGTDLPTGGGAAQHLTIIPAQSSFSIGPDQRGCMVLTTSAGSSTYRFVLGAVGAGSGVSSFGRIIDFQQNGAFGSGFLRLQDPAFLITPSLSGSYAFLFTAPSSLANIGHWGMLGSFNASGGAVTNGSWDYNDTQKIDGGSTWPTTGLQFPANESYGFDATGRGTIQLPSVQQLSQSSTLASANVVIYPLGSSEFFAAVLPDANNKPLAGDIQQQVAPFASLAFNGAGYVYGVSSAPISASAQVGAFSASQNAWSLSFDNDLGGTYSTGANSGTFAVDSTGRVPLANNGSTSPGPMVQVIGPNKSFFMTPDGAASTGFVHNFPGGIPPSTVVGSYDFGPAEATMDRKATNLAGIAVFDALGNVTFTQDQATGSTNTLTPGAVVTSTYSYTASTGRGVIPATGAPHFVFYATGQNVIYLLDVTSADPQVQELDPLTPPALTLSPDPLQLFVGGSGTMGVILGAPAGSGGQVVTLSSSNSTIASVPASVTIAAGNQGISFQVTAGANVGSVDITASAAGLAATNATVVVSPLTMSVAPDSPLLAINRSFNATVTLVQPAGGDGVTVGLSASPSGLVTISPASQTIAAGQTTAVFSLTAGATSGSLQLTATATGYINATAPLAVTGNLISFGTIPVLGPGQSASLPVSLSFAAPTGGLTINFTSTNSTVATVTPSVFVPAGLLIPSANPQVTGGAIGSAQINATATGFAPDSASVSVTVTGTLSPGSISVNAQRSVNVTLTISAAAPAGGITFNLASDTTSVATVPATTTVQPGQLTATFAVTGVTQGTANLNVSSPGITTITAAINVGAAPLINLSTPIVGNNLVEQGSLSLNVAPPTTPSNPTITLTSSDPTHFLLTGDPTKVGTASITLPLTAGSTSVPAYYIEGQNYSGSTAITATLTASASGYADGTTALTLYPTGLTYWPGSNGTLNTTTFSSPSTLTIYLVLLTPGTLTAYNYGYNLGPQAPGAVPVAVTSTNTSAGTVTGSPSSIGVGTYFTQAISFVPGTVGTTNLNLTEPTGYSTPSNVAVQMVSNVTATPINLSFPTVGNNLIEQGNVSLGAAPPATPPNPTLTLTSSDPTHFLLTTDSTKVGTASITLALTPGSTSVPTFYIEGQNFSGSAAITATLTATSSGYATATSALTLYPTGLTYWPGSSGALSTTTFSAPSTLTIYLVLLSPGTLNAYNYGYPLGPQAPGSVPVAVTSSNTSVGTVTGSPSSIGVGAYYTQAISFVPAGAGTTNLNITEPTGYSTPSNVAVQMVTTVTAPALNLSAPVIGNNLIAQGSISLGATPPATPPNPSITLTSSDPTHFLLTADATKVGSASITLPLTPGSFNVPAYYIEGQNFTGTAAITATLTATSAGYANGTFTMTLYPTGLSFWPGSGGTLSTTTFSSPSVLTAYLVLLTPGTLNAYNYGFPLGPQAPGAVPVAVTSSSTSVGVLTGSPSSIGVGTYYTQAISFVPATAGTTNLTIAEPTGYFTPANVAVQIAATVTAPPISLSIPVIGNNMIAQGSVSLGAAPPSAETLTLTSSDPTHFLLTADPTKVGSAQIKLQLTGGSQVIPPFYIEGQNFSGAGAITATLTASAAGYNDGTFTLTLYPTGLSYWPGSGGTLIVNANSSPAVLTVYLVLLSPGTLNAYNYGFPLGPQAPGAVPVAVTSTNTGVGTVSGSPASIGVGAYYTQAISFVPVATGTTNLPLTTPGGYFTPSNVAVNLVVTVQ